jgi:hypothetical protein
VGYVEQALTWRLQMGGVVKVLVYTRHASGSAMVLTPQSANAATACPTSDSTWVRTSRALLLADPWMKPLHVTLMLWSLRRVITTRCRLLSY